MLSDSISIKLASQKRRNIENTISKWQIEKIVQVTKMFILYNPSELHGMHLGDLD